MPDYKVKKDYTILKKQVGEYTSRRGKVVPKYESFMYMSGDVLPEEEIAPATIEAYKNGDETVAILIEEVEVAKPKATKKPATKKTEAKKKAEEIKE